MFYFVKRLATLRIVTEPTFIDNKLIKQKVIKEERTFQKYNCTAETMPPTVLHVGDIIGLLRKITPKKAKYSRMMLLF